MIWKWFNIELIDENINFVAWQIRVKQLQSMMNYAWDFSTLSKVSWSFLLQILKIMKQKYLFVHHDILHTMLACQKIFKIGNILRKLVSCTHSISECLRHVLDNFESGSCNKIICLRAQVYYVFFVIMTVHVVFIIIAILVCNMEKIGIILQNTAIVPLHLQSSPCPWISKYKIPKLKAFYCSLQWFEAGKVKSKSWT